MALPIKAFIRELKEILEDIRNNKNLDANSAENGFSDSYNLKTEIHYLNEIEKKLEQERKTKIVEKIINKDGEKLTEDEFLRLIRKDGKLARIFQDLKSTITEIGRQGKRIQMYENCIDKIVESTKARYDAIKHIHVWLVKRLIAISQSIEELKEEFADWELALRAAPNLQLRAFLSGTSTVKLFDWKIPVKGKMHAKNEF